MMGFKSSQRWFAKGKATILDSETYRTCQTIILSGISINYRYDLDDEMWFGRGPAAKNVKEKSCQSILNLGERGCLVKSDFGYFRYGLPCARPSI
jgi:hypothetical protein